MIFIPIVNLNYSITKKKKLKSYITFIQVSNSVLKINRLVKIFQLDIIDEYSVLTKNISWSVGCLNAINEFSWYANVYETKSIQVNF